MRISSQKLFAELSTVYKDCHTIMTIFQRNVKTSSSAESPGVVLESNLRLSEKIAEKLITTLLALGLSFFSGIAYAQGVSYGRGLTNSNLSSSCLLVPNNMANTDFSRLQNNSVVSSWANRRTPSRGQHLKIEDPKDLSV